MCYYFWGVRACGGETFDTANAPDWAWAEWVQEQGIGE
jgi:hypothetical protein